MGSDEEQFTYAMQLATSTSLTMVLVNAIKLKVFETIAHAGPDSQLSAHEIVSRLSIPNPNAPQMLDRMLRLLASHSIVTCNQRDHDSGQVRVYGLAPVAKYFIPNGDGVSLCAYMELGQDKVFMESWFKLKDSVVEGGVPFDMVHGTHAFEYPALDARFNELFNNAMLNHTTIVMNKVLECYHGFENLTHVVDVGGGLGVNLNIIVSKYPTIKGINFDVPHVIQHAPVYRGIEHIAGNMFEEVPQGDAIFMKWILHDWSNDYCEKLLKNCYKALPTNGKVIVVEHILPFLPITNSSYKLITHMDAIMMTQNPGGKERTEDEFLVLAKNAGFTGIKKECFICSLWVMEFYK
ncbi:hypothetical protein L2E82_21706 [Cichorium intybus]|uniref:Uncharacterized protein n=1 Tax=Cichorium intybus TaxID=13427 RepID=A0ACB9DW27_CICIN|nr:hypothetical protein L2E82_21706 [Cichorium intybus]